MKKTPLIGIIYDNNGLLTSIRKYIKYNKTDSNIFAFTPKDINWLSLTINGTYFIDDTFKTNEFPFPDVVYNRRFSSKTRIIEKFENFIGKGKIFNYTNRFSKWEVYNYLSKTYIQRFLPVTYKCTSFNVLDILHLHNSLFIKPDIGSKGRYVYRIESNREGTKTIFYKTFKSSDVFYDDNKFILELEQLIDNKPYIAQAEVPMIKIEDRIFDIRIMLQKDLKGTWNISSAISRLSLNNYFITNLYYKILSAEQALKAANLNSRALLGIIYDISISTATLLELHAGPLGEISVDFGVDKGGYPWIIEINGIPDKSIFKGLKDKEIIRNIYSKPIEYAYFLSQRQP
jgi:hypothetical protein